ncbi:sel1 repeat family protein [Pelomyxa schiedti]|nr:sel1 repeat family protein [Pelomyxa schiedti]
MFLRLNSSLVDWTCGKGRSICQFELGSHCLEERNPREAAKLFKLASDQGLPEAQYAVANWYAQKFTFKGCCGERNEQDALRLWRLADNQGLAEAQCALGVCFMDGDLVPQDDQSAARFFSVAAEAGFHEAQFHLATLDNEGRGVEQDTSKAVTLLKQASQSGLIEAHVKLGVLYTTGPTSTPEDLTLARNHFRVAANNGSPEAAWCLALLMCHGDVPGATKPEALELLHKAWMSTWTKRYVVAVSVGEMCEGGHLGRTPTKDVREAVRWYKLAVDCKDGG